MSTSLYVSKEYNYVELNEEMKAIGPSLVKTKVGKVWYTVLSAEVTDNKDRRDCNVDLDAPDAEPTEIMGGDRGDRNDNGVDLDAPDAEGRECKGTIPVKVGSTGR